MQIKETPMPELIRINKRIADLGLASRREADALIETGQILVNGRPAVLGQKVTPADDIAIAGVTKTKKYLAYYKGRGVITHSPAPGEIDIITKLKSDYSITDMNPVGRLDKDSEGLIILSNDGRITAPLLSPEANIAKIYEVEVDKPITSLFLHQIEAGVNIEGYITKPATATKKSTCRFLLTIKEGKKHQIRRMCAALGFQVQSLKRIQIANITLGDIKPNQYRKIAGTELSEFLNTLSIS